MDPEIDISGPMFDPEADRAHVDPTRAYACARIAIDVYRMRRTRTRIFGQSAALFGEPAWDILLNLYIVRSNARAIAVKQAAMADDIPQTTGLRILTALEEHGLVVRTSDPKDNRRWFVAMTEAAVALIEDSLLAIHDQTGSRRPVRKRRSRAKAAEAKQILRAGLEDRSDAEKG